MRKSIALIALVLVISSIYVFLGCGNSPSTTNSSPSPNPSGSSGGSSFTAIATGLTSAYDIFLYNGYIYWSERGAPGRVCRIKTNGGTVQEVATGLTSPIGITTDGTYIYVCEFGNSAIRRKKISDIGLNTSSDIYIQATDGGVITNPLFIKYSISTGKLYFTQYVSSQGKLCSIDPQGNGHDIITSLSNPYGFDIDPTTSFAFISEMVGVNNSRLLRISLSNGTGTVLYQGGSLSYGTSVKYDGVQYVYWADYVAGSGVYRVDITNANPASTIKVVAQGSNVLAYDLFGPISGKIYFSDNRSQVAGGTIYSQDITNLTASPANVITSNDANSPFRLTISGGLLYWTEFPSFDIGNIGGGGGSSDTRVCSFILQ